jgi:Fic family protein
MIKVTQRETFRATHPWLTFSADLRRAPARLWTMLGECQSKCEHIARVPLRPSTADHLYRVYLAKGVLATTAIEGNTLSEEEVLRHLEGKLKLPPSREYLSREIDNIVSACNGILKAIASDTVPDITLDSIRSLNRTVLAGLSLDDGVVPGEIRCHSVTVGRYRAAPAADCEYLVEKLCEWLNSQDFAAPEGLVIAYALLKAIIAHLYLAWIHPFGDGNGRTARLLEFQILISCGVPAASAHLLSNHYNLTRAEYYRQLDQASTSGGDIIPFIVYGVQGFLDGLKQQLDVIWEQQWDITWRNYVHEFFRDKRSETAIRRRRLVLDLSQHEESVPLSALPEISPRIALAYATKTPRTLMRDVNALRKANLIVKDDKGYRARREIILAFLPQRAGRQTMESTG